MLNIMERLTKIAYAVTATCLALLLFALLLVLSNEIGQLAYTAITGGH